MNRAKELFRSYKFATFIGLTNCGLSCVGIDRDVYVLQD